MFAEEVVGGVLQFFVAESRGEDADVDAVIDVEESTKPLAARLQQIPHLPCIRNHGHATNLLL